MKYPCRSYLFYLVLCLGVILFDANYLIHYSLSLIAELLIYNHPSFSSYFREVVTIFGVSRKLKDFTDKMK